MYGRLTVYFRERPARIFMLRPGSRILLGRDASCDLRVDDDRVSRQHVAFDFRDTQWHCEDLGSKNGIRVNGEIARALPLPPGAWLDFGGLLAQFTTLDERERETARANAVKREQASRDAAQRLDPARGIAPMLADLLESVLTLGGMQRAFLMLRDDDIDFEIVATRHFLQQDFTAASFTGSLAAVREALMTRTPVMSCDVAGVSRFAARPSIVTGGIRAFVCLPLQTGQEPDGVVYADSRVPGKILDELDIEILAGFADHAALALAAAALRDELDDIAGGLPALATRSHAPAAAIRAARAGMQESAAGKHGSVSFTLGELLRAHAHGEGA